MRRQKQAAPRIALTAAWVTGGAATVLNVVRPAFLSLPGSSARAVLETGAMLAAALVTYLAYGRWRRTALLRDLLVCFAFAVVSASQLLFAVLPLLVVRLESDNGIAAAAVISSLPVALLLLAAALVPERHAAPSSRTGRDAACFSLVLVVVALCVREVGAKVGGHLGETEVTVLQLATACGLAATGALFIRRSGAESLFSSWLGVAAMLWAFAVVNLALTPQRLTQSLTVGDWLRCAAYAILVVAAASEIHAYWRGATERATLEERRRIARELHDGLAQELAFIAGHAAVLARNQPDSRRVQLLRSASERALDESRRAIAALTRPLDEPLEAELARTAEEVASRLGARLYLDLEHSVSVKPDSRDVLVRIVREAVTNAVRHGQATRVNVSLANHDGATLTIADNGRGFDPAEVSRDTGHLGIRGMRERALTAGGLLEISSRPYGGTVITARVP